GAAPGPGGGRAAALARGRRDRAAPLGILQPMLPRHVRGSPLEPLPQPGVLSAHRRAPPPASRDGACRARWPADRLRPFSDRLQNALRPLLGRDRARTAPALRMLLLPGDR